MSIPQEVIEKVRESNDIVDIVSEYVSLKKRGKNFVGLCPFHSEKTPSFSVQQNKQMYYCFGCGEGGNVITFLMKHRNLSFVEAVKQLAERANIVIPDKDNVVDYEKINLKEKLLQINRESAKFFYLNLQKTSEAVDYFNKRGIDQDIIKRFGLGYAFDRFDGLMKYLSYKGYSLDLIEQAGLVIKNEKSKYYDRFRKRVMFPVFDIRGRVIGFGGRVLDNSKPKYLNSPETLVFNKGDNLYGLNLVAKNNDRREIIIVEGYMDTIALHQYGIINVVASLGTALTLSQAKLLKRYADEVIICYDSDAAGQAATLRGLDIIAGAGCSVKVINIPKGKDPDEYIRAEGKDAFIKCVQDAMPLVEYKLKRKSEGYDIATTEGKIGFIKAIAGELVKINDPVITDAYINKLSNETGIAASALYEEISRRKNVAETAQRGAEGHINGKSRYNNNIDGQKLYLETAYDKAEKSILYILYEMKEYFNVIEKKLSWEDFSDATYKKIACILYEKLGRNEDIVPSYIISTFETTEEMKKASEVFNINVSADSGKVTDIINDYINMISKRKLIGKKASLDLKLKEAERKGDIEGLAQLLKERMEIEKQLRMQ